MLLFFSKKSPPDIRDLKHHDGRHDDGIPEVYFPFRSCAEPEKLIAICRNLVPRAHVPFGQHQDTELWNNQFPESKILGVPVSRRTRVPWFTWRPEIKSMCMHSTKAFNTHWKKIGKSKFGFERTAALHLKSKRHEGSGNEDC